MTVNYLISWEWGGVTSFLQIFIERYYLEITDWYNLVGIFSRFPVATGNNQRSATLNLTHRTRPVKQAQVILMRGSTESNTVHSENETATDLWN